jgi:hypothetical protein
VEIVHDILPSLEIAFLHSCVFQYEQGRSLFLYLLQGAKELEKRVEGA